MMQKLYSLKQATKEGGYPPVSYIDYEDYGPAMNSHVPTSLHHGMFENVVRILGSDEQVEEYLPKIISYEILG